MPGLLQRVRSLLQSPADRRLAAAEAAAWSTVARPAHELALRAAEPWSGQPQNYPRSPTINWMQDQPAPPPSRYSFQPGYSDHTYQQFGAPLGFEGFSLERIRNAVAQHRLGIFWESSLLKVAILGFAPVLAALQQAIAPILDLKRHVHGGERGLAKLVAEEVREQLVPGDGLQPSIYLPPELWGTMAINLRMDGFCVLQHVDGEPDDETGVRPRFTRVWDSWAVNAYRSPRKWIALTTEGPVEIKNDGKFTLVCDTNEPHLFDAAICALGEEALGGKITQEARNSWIEFFGKPKLYATLPEKIATEGPAGNAFLAALETIYGPDGRGVLPFSAKLDAVGITGEGTEAFQDALLDQIIHIFMVLTGSAGTIGSGGPTGAGPYQPQKGGPWNVRHDLIARPTICIVRGINGGHVKPFCDGNYGEAIQRSPQWEYPRLEIPLPDPDRDERIKSVIEREKARTDIIDARRKNGILVDQASANRLADKLEVEHVELAERDPLGAPVEQWEIEQKVFSIDEARERKGAAPLPDGAGSVEQLARERLAGRDETGAVKKTEQVDEVDDEQARTKGGSGEDEAGGASAA